MDESKDHVHAIDEIEYNLDRNRKPSLTHATRFLSRTALLPFHNLVIDSFTREQWLTSGFDTGAKRLSETLVTGFRQFSEVNKDEINVLGMLYCRSRSTTSPSASRT